MAFNFFKNTLASNLTQTNNNINKFSNPYSNQSFSGGGQYGMKQGGTGGNQTMGDPGGWRSGSEFDQGGGGGQWNPGTGGGGSGSGGSGGTGGGSGWSTQQQMDAWVDYFASSYGQGMSTEQYNALWGMLVGGSSSDEIWEWAQTNLGFDEDDLIDDDEALGDESLEEEVQDAPPSTEEETMLDGLISGGKRGAKSLYWGGTGGGASQGFSSSGYGA